MITLAVKLISVFQTTLIYRKDSSVHILTGYRLDSQGSIPGRDNRLFSSPRHPHCLWVPPSLLFSGYQVPYPWG
jgi:hypothetical protein